LQEKKDRKKERDGEVGCAWVKFWPYGYGSTQVNEGISRHSTLEQAENFCDHFSKNTKS
jgi:hypothetical protein